MSVGLSFKAVHISCRGETRLSPACASTDMNARGLPRRPLPGASFIPPTFHFILVLCNLEEHVFGSSILAIANNKASGILSHDFHQPGTGGPDLRGSAPSPNTIGPAFPGPGIRLIPAIPAPVDRLLKFPTSTHHPSRRRSAQIPKIHNKDSPKEGCHYEVSLK